MVTAAGLAPLPPSRVYQLWIMNRRGARSAALLAAAGHSGAVLAGPVRSRDRTGITVEPVGGTSRPTTTPVVSCRCQPEAAGRPDSLGGTHRPGG